MRPSETRPSPPPGPGSRALLWFLALFLALGTLATPLLRASGPRFVTGPPFFTGTAGKPVGWKQPNLLYFTDPGDLSATVNHQAADALVAAAAGVWNIPVASITVAHGGALLEHVNGQNAYLSSDGMVWPADVMSSNAASIPVAVVYDTDGSVTDTLLGAGASDPSGCEQNSVLETVDAFDPAGYILHAIVVLNGRCTGAAPEQQLQMQYQLQRIFGRILGLAWSQANDNVFTGSPTPTYNQALYWPIMHPLDILCGAYSYQCLPQPFVLRPDDMAGLVGLYPIATTATPPAGKQASLTMANSLTGTLTFPSGEGMAGVNVVVQRQNTYTTTLEPWIETSGVSGSLYRLADVSPFVARQTTAAASMGSTAAASQGVYVMPYMQIIDRYNEQTEVVSTEPVNPLYIGTLSIGPYAPGIVAPAGTAPTPYAQFGVPPLKGITVNFTMADAPPACGNGLDGTMAAPMATPPTGWWSGLLCGYGHASYVAANIRPGRSLAIEITATDVNGLATTTKAMPVIGLFAPTDAAGSLPSLGVAPNAFNSLGVGTTTLAATPFAAGGPGGTIRMGIADQRGDGRPDLSYQARLFYADQASPANLPLTGPTNVTISGLGFRAGNQVTVNGVVAPVVSQSSTTIVITAPEMAADGALPGVPVDVEVSDLGTGASSVMTGALTYGGASPTAASMRLVSAPAAVTNVGDTAAGAFAVQLLASDGSTPVAGAPVLLSATNGKLLACGQTACSVATDANGSASSQVSPTAAGTVSLLAANGTLTQTASFGAQVMASGMKLLQAPSGTVLVGKAASPVFAVQVVNSGGSGLAGQTVTFSIAPGSTGSANYSTCSQSTCSVVTNSSGQASLTVTPTAAGSVTLQASDGSLIQTATFTAAANPNLLVFTQQVAPPVYPKVATNQLLARLTQSDGVTGIARVPVTLTAPAGVIFTTCGTSTCVLDTDSQGNLGSALLANAVGTFVLQASYGDLTASTSMTVIAVPPSTMKIISAPSGSLPVGVTTAIPFTVQVLNGQGKPVPSVQVALGGPLDEVTMGCGVPSCQVITNGNGVATESIRPLKPGPISLEAVYGQIIQTATFTAVGPGETFTIVTAPPATLAVGASFTFSLLAISADGVTPAANKQVRFTVTNGNVAIKGCQLGLCGATTNAAGMVTLNGTASVAGLDTISAALDGLVQTVSFTVTQPVYTMKTLSAPTGTYIQGTPVSVPFKVQVLAADGVTPGTKQNVTFSIPSGSASLAACVIVPCVVVTDANGMASTGTITLNTPGTVVLSATDNALGQTATFKVLSNIDTVTLQGSQPTVYQGATTTTPFALSVTLSDGTTPVANVPVILSTASGTAIFSACGAATCALTTNANGRISSNVQGTTPGTATLLATVKLSTGNQTVSAPFTVMANIRSITALEATTYLAEAAQVPLEVDIQAVQNGIAAQALGLTWTGATGFSVLTKSATTDNLGKASAQTVAGPLAAGRTANVSACAWTTVCATFAATGVSASQFRLSLTSGAQQAVSGGATLQPIVVRVLDTAGHPIAGANVTVGETVSAYDGACPATGRCPASPILTSTTAQLTTNLLGQASVVPIGIPGQATTTALAFSSGLNGFATAIVSNSP